MKKSQLNAIYYAQKRKKEQAQAARIGIYTACDLSKFYEYEKQDGENIGATVARYAAELFKD